MATGTIKGLSGWPVEVLCGSSGAAAVTSGYVSSLKSGVTFNQIRLYRVGKVCMLICYASLTSTIPADTDNNDSDRTLFNIAAEVRPIYVVTSPLFNGNHRLFQSKGVRINTSGDVVVSTSADMDSGTQIRFAIMYMTAN